MTANQEIKIYLKKFESEQTEIDNQRIEIGRQINTLEREDIKLADRFSKLESIIDKCQRALAGEPVSIWAELQRFGL